MSLPEITKEDKEVIGQLIELVFVGGAKQAKKYLSNKKIIRVTFRGPKDSRYKTMDALVFVGPPNFNERADLKAGRAEAGFTDLRYFPDKKKK